MKLAIMQPYFFPYIGYFQLVNAVDKFVFYDDVNYIKNGWINRNRILLNGKPHYITVHQKDASPNKLIKDVEIIDNRRKLKKTLLNAYIKAPYFNSAWPLVEKILEFKTDKISDLAAYSVMQTCHYLGVEVEFELSSEKYAQTSSLKSGERLIAICKITGASEYINPIGGVGLYDKRLFLNEGIELFFLKTDPINYRQFGNIFIQSLSIVDLIMFNSCDSIHELLGRFELI